MLGAKNVLRQTPKGGGETFFRRPIVLKEEAMERLGITKHLYYQIAIATGGPGCWIKNSAGFIDAYLYGDPGREILVYRHEVYGIPDEAAVERYNKLFLLKLILQKEYK